MRARWPLPVLLALPLFLACGTGSTEDSAGDSADSSTGEAPAGSGSNAAGDVRQSLDDPQIPELNEQGPDVWRARFQTTQGNFMVEVHREWAPIGADRFYNLVNNGYFDGMKFFRVVAGFMAQFGIHGDPAISMRWLEATLQDEPVTQSNTRGRITYAKSGAPNSRSVQLFINYGNNAALDRQGFAPFGEVIEGMDVVDSLYSGYGNATTSRQGEIAMQGDAFLDANFPELDSIVTAAIVD